MSHNNKDSSANDENRLKEISDDMYNKTNAYFRAELELTLDDYKLLEDMNCATAKKYGEINEIATNVSKTVDAMNDKYATLLPHLEAIDALEERVAKLETMAYAIDAYSKRLGMRGMSESLSDDSYWLLQLPMFLGESDFIININKNIQIVLIIFVNQLKW